MILKKHWTDSVKNDLDIVEPFLEKKDGLDIFESPLQLFYYFFFKAHSKDETEMRKSIPWGIIFFSHFFYQLAADENAISSIKVSEISPKFSDVTLQLHISG